VITKRLCLVLGAGASQPYGFPPGSELLRTITRQPEEWWPLIANVLPGTTTDTHPQFLRHLNESGLRSLDYFAGAQPDWKKYIQALIAFHIGNAENPGRFLDTPRDADWQNFLLQRLVDGRTLGELADPPLSVVTFNFDRSFEEGLLVRLSAIYRSSGERPVAARVRVAQAIARWKIVHVHGNLGLLPELATGAAASRPYARHEDAAALALAMDRITLLNDAQHDSTEFKAARELIRSAEMVLFLGFAFHRFNCKRVLPNDWTDNHPRVMGTCLKMTAGEIAKTHGYFKAAGGPGIELHDCDSLALLQMLEAHYSD
jgi:hypothetical protein